MAHCQLQHMNPWALHPLHTRITGVQKVHASCRLHTCPPHRQLYSTLPNPSHTIMTLDMATCTGSSQGVLTFQAWQMSGALQ